ncbi:hypothetical protein D3C81_1625210 [compost metagenome]
MGFDQVAGQRQEETVGQGEDAKAGDHPPLGGAAGAQAAGGLVQVAEVAGQLALEELRGIHAADGEQAFMGERTEEC